MRASPRTLTVVGSAFVLSALAFIFLRPDGFRKTDDSGVFSSAAAGWIGGGKSEPRENTKRSQRIHSLGMDDPEVQRKAELWYQDLLVRHPEFQIEFKDVPDEENGFLQFLNLLDDLKPGDPHSASLPIDDDLSGILGGTKPFDAALLDAWIAGNPELFQRILGIAEAPGQSVKGLPMDRYHFISAGVGHKMGQLLQSSARAAMDRGDTEKALRYHRASLNLASHFDGIEIPSLLSKTVSSLLRLCATGNFHEHILPRLIGNPEVLRTWHEAMPQPEIIDDTVPELLKGEWHVGIRKYVLPALISGQMGILDDGTGETPELETAEQHAVIESYTSQMGDYIRKSPATPVGNLIDGSDAVIRDDPSLSPAGNNFLELFRTGFRGWLKGLGRQNSVSAQHDAILAIALGEEPPPEPITGEPFLWDPATMTLSPPAALDPFGFEIKPLKLPSR